MAALTKDTQINAKDQGRSIDAKVAAGAVIYNGAMVAMNASGYAVPCSDAAGLAMIGLAEEGADNTGGANGDLTVRCRKGTFELKTSGGFALTQADVGRDCYVLDDATVVMAAGTASAFVAGTLDSLDVETGRPWVTLFDQALGSEAEDRLPFTDIVFDPTLPPQGNRYDDWETALANCNLIADEFGDVTLMHRAGGAFLSTISVPAPTGGYSTVVSVSNVRFAAGGAIETVDFAAGHHWDGAPASFESNKLTIWKWNSAEDEPCVNTEDAEHVGVKGRLWIFGNRGAHRIQSGSGFPFLRIHEGLWSTFLFRGSRLQLEDDDMIVVEGQSPNTPGRFRLEGQGGFCKTLANFIKSENAGDGKLQLQLISYHPGSSNTFEAQANFSGVYDLETDFADSPRMVPDPLDGTEHTSDFTADYGKHARIGAGVSTMTLPAVLGRAGDEIGGFNNAGGNVTAATTGGASIVGAGTPATIADQTPFLYRVTQAGNTVDNGSTTAGLEWTRII